MTSCCSLFREVSNDSPFSAEEFEQIMEFMCEWLVKLPAADVPPMVYQILLLSRQISSARILAALAEYFEKGRPRNVLNTDSEDMDIVGENLKFRTCSHRYLKFGLRILKRKNQAKKRRNPNIFFSCSYSSNPIRHMFAPSI